MENGACFLLLSEMNVGTFVNLVLEWLELELLVEFHCGIHKIYFACLIYFFLYYMFLDRS